MMFGTVAIHGDTIPDLAILTEALSDHGIAIVQRKIG
jgi:hypothetical protein